MSDGVKTGEQYTEYKDLAPINNTKEGMEYLNALDWAFKNPKIKNIALAGPYGAGKSSIIETYLNQQEKKIDEKNKLKYYYNKYKLSKKYLKISMATFVEGHDNSKGENKKIQIDSEEVEEGILKQLFYKVDHRKIPQSRYRKLRTIKSWPIFIKTAMILCVILMLSSIFIPKFYENIQDKIKEFIVLHKMPEYSLFGVKCVIFGVVVFGIGCLWKKMVSNYSLKEVKISAKAEATIQKEDEKDNSVFNKNLDEIMYFFESTSYQVVFLEDLDRIEDRKIFVHLRELNNLLNNDDMIKHKPIVFVYAVKDDIFSKEDRTKFFDFIIPVIPVINSTNSGDILLRKLNEANEKSIKHDISKWFVLDVAPFISDMRILQNIYNEFIVYKKILRTDQKLELSDEQIMAIMIFKNLYPSDFADIQDERGIIKSAFRDKNTYIARKKEMLQKQIDQVSEKIEKAENDALKSVSELKYAMLVELTNGKGIVDGFGNGWTRSNNWKIELKDIISPEFDMNRILDYKYAGYIEFYAHRDCMNLDDCRDCIEDYIRRWEALKEYKDKGLQGLQEEINRLKKQQYDISRKKLKYLLESYHQDEILSESVRKNKFLVFLLRRGYINEEYPDHINYFKGDSITREDMNFILSIKNQEPQSFHYSLKMIDRIIERLQEYEFEQKAIYNFQLLEQLLSKEENDNKLKIFIKQLSDEKEESWQFIDEFINWTEYLEKFICLLANEWKGIWLYISSLITMTYEQQLTYLYLILKYLDEDEIESINMDDCLKKYFEEHPDILQKLESLDNQKLNTVIDKLNILFSDLLIDDVSDSILEYIFDNCHFVLNEKMVKNVIWYKNIARVKDFETKPYSTIMNLQYQPLLIYINKNIGTYVREVVLKKAHIEDEKQDIMELLGRIIDERELCISLIKHEKFKLENLEECLGEEVSEKESEIRVVWDSILTENKVKATWKNILTYWKNYSISECLKGFIISNTSELMKDKNRSVKDKFIEDFIYEDFPNHIAEQLLPLLRMEEFDFELEELSEDILRIMVDCNYFEFTIEYYDYMKDMYPNISIEFIIKNQEKFTLLLNEIRMTETLLETLLFHEEMQQDIKELLFDAYVEEYMTEKIAKNMNSAGFNVTIDVFCTAWDILNAEDQEKLMFDNLLLLDANQIEKCFYDLGGMYSGLADRTRRHEVKLDLNDKNLYLAQYLKKIEYITNYDDKEKKISNATTGRGRSSLRQVLIFRIKKVKQNLK